MTYDTISDVVTMQPGAEGTLLAGRYRIVRQLGQGGMGSVWLAEDTQLDNKQFAIKMLPSILVSNKRAYRQLKDEALVAMKLTHPNIVTLRAFEENNGNPFLVMDYIDGQTLDDYLAEVGNGEQGTGNGRAASTRPPSGGLPEDEVIRLLKPIAAALDYAHSKGVVHRDVKPGNVMIAKDGTPYILDFGIAREIQETMTRVTGKLSSGTLLYMSPEQLNGDMPKPAQDVYSFAAMVYECLKGEPPFSRGNIEFQIMNKMPAPLDPHFAKSGSVMQGLEKKPEDRPKTCAAVLEGNASRGGTRTRRNEDGRASTYAEASVGRDGSTGHPPDAGTPVAQERNVSGGALPVICVMAAFAVLVGWLWYRGAQRRESADRDSCIANLKQIETAMEQCLMGGEIPTPEHLFAPNRYFRNEPTCPLGGHYKINKSDTGYTVVCPHADEGHRWPLSGAPNIIKANWEVAPSARLVAKKEITAPKHGDTKTLTLPGGATMEMIYCGPGTFMMGSPQSEEVRDDDEAQHRVTLTKGFWLGKYEVTQEQWQSVMGDNPSHFKGDRNPVECVSWEDCQRFIEKVNARLNCGARLPTEAEWEYACRAGTTSEYAGDGLDRMGWYDGNSSRTTHPVGQKQANPWGFYDMHGNVWEWCNDWYDSYGGNATDPQGPASGDFRVLRGGSREDYARSCRSAARGRNQPGYRYDIYGFRLCCSEMPPH